MLEIKTNQLKTRKSVEIDGHPYTVRRFGAGEQLTLNQLMRRGSKLETLLKTEEATEALEAEAEELSQRMIDIFVGLFDDGGDGSKSKALVSSLGVDEIQELFRQIFVEESDEPTAIS
jgi:hypothetical protein